MKAIHRSDLATSLDEAARAFDASYTEAVESTMPPDLPGALRHVGALLIARVHGKSPAEYLTQHEQHHAERVAQRALEGRMQSLEDLFSWREETRE